MALDFASRGVHPRCAADARRKVTRRFPHFRRREVLREIGRSRPSWLICCACVVDVDRLGSRLPPPARRKRKNQEGRRENHHFSEYFIYGGTHTIESKRLTCVSSRINHSSHLESHDNLGCREKLLTNKHRDEMSSELGAEENLGLNTEAAQNKHAKPRISKIN